MVLGGNRQPINYGKLLSALLLLASQSPEEGEKSGNRAKKSICLRS